MRHSKDYKERLFVSADWRPTLGSQLPVDPCAASEAAKVVVLLSASDDRWVATPEERLNSPCV